MEEVVVDDKKELQKVDEKVTVETIINKLVKAPELRVDRESFLREILSKEVNNIQSFIDNGPIDAGIDEKTLRKVAKKLILKRTTKSAIDSFAVNGSAMEIVANEISNDTIKFFGSLLKLSQELGYLYGMQDFWIDGTVGEDMIRKQLLLYYAAMVGAKGVTVAVNKIANGIHEKTKSNLILSSVVSVVGSAVSGAVTFAAMTPMAEKLLKTLEDATFHNEELQKDVEIIDVVDENKVVEEKTKKESLLAKGKEKLGGLFKKKDKKQDDEYEQIKKLKELLDIGAITEEEFEQKKKQILGL